MECDGLVFDKAGDCPVCGMHLAQQATASSTYICPMECDGLVFDKAGDCPVCGMHLEPKTEDGFFDEESLTDGAVAPQSALMPGLDERYAIGASVLLFLLWLIALVRLDVDRSPKRSKFVRSGILTKAAKKRWPQFVAQFLVVAVFVFVIIAGLFGSGDARENIAPVLTWNVWWMGLIFFAFFAGEIWCAVCPWMAIPDWVSRFAGRVRGAAPMSLNFKWPKQLRNVYPAIVMFVAITWLELANDAPFRPQLTAFMALGMVAMAAATVFVFERKSFCRYVCLVGRVTGSYGMTGMLEIRHTETQTCKTCETKDCFNGNDNGLPCPTFEFMGAMHDNMNCTMCTECLKSCPHDNIQVNVRAPFSDLMDNHRKRFDEAWLAVAIFIVTFFHGVAMVPAWLEPLKAQQKELGWTYLQTFTASMILFVLASIVVWTIVVGIVYLGTRSKARTFKQTFIGLAYVLIPISLGYHLAHNVLHFFYEGSKLIRLSSDPMGFGWDLFGTIDMPLTLFLPMPILWAIQVGFLVLGTGGAYLAGRNAVHRLYANRIQRQRAWRLLSFVILLVACVSLWLLFQPMEMRTA